MKDSTSLTAAGRHPLWLLGLLVVLAAQGWLTLGLFDADRTGRRLLDDEPLVGGRHPLHLYHGHLGARAFLDRGSLTCFDPAFHAGYPKTPVFDPGSRPAEFALACGGGSYSPRAYKVAVAAFCLAFPLGLYLAARAMGLCRGIALLGTVLGLTVFWGRLGREALDAGDLDRLLASLMLLVQAGMFVRYHRHPGVVGLGGVVAGGTVAWFAHPLLSLLVLPLFLVYYLTVGHRHRVGWHLPLFLGLLAALAANAFWLGDLVTYWWIRVPQTREITLEVPRTAEGWWHAPLWGSGFDKGLLVALLLLGLGGILILNRTSQRATARLFALGIVGFLGLAAAGVCWEPFARLGTPGLLLPGLLFASLPASLALARGLDLLRRWGGTSATPAVLLLVGGGLVAVGQPEAVMRWGRAVVESPTLEIGLGDDREAMVAALTEATTDSARILWEDRRDDSRWPALLPLLTGRAYIGGLDADAGIEYTATGLVEGALAGKELEDWEDQELVAYCRRYNVGWVVCWSPEACERLARWKTATLTRTFAGNGTPRYLYSLQRKASFTLTGAATWRAADAQGILLADVQPHDGEVVLSLHYQEGMRVRPGRVVVERAVDSQDAIPFVRLRLTEPVGRLLITWEGR